MAWNGSYIKNVFSAIALLLSLCADGFAAGRLLTDTVLNPSMFSRDGTQCLGLCHGALRR